MTASGRVNPEIFQPYRLHQEILIGFEFSGLDLRCYYSLKKQSYAVYLQWSENSGNDEHSRYFFLF